MRRALAIASTTLVAVALAAGCGDDETADTGASPTTQTESSGGYAAPPETTTTESESSGGPNGKAVEVEMRDLAFQPSRITIKVGQTVKWENYDDVVHNVSGEGTASFASKNFGRGGEYELTPKAAGTLRYVCTLHPSSMEGTITVTAS